MKTPPLAAWALGRLSTGLEVNGEMEALPEPFRGMARHLAQVSVPGDLVGRRESLAIARKPHFDAMLAARPELAEALATVDPEAPAPGGHDNGIGGATEAGRRRSAHLGDLQASASANRFVWPSWIVRGHFNLLSSDPKVGKTHLALDLARRLWLGLPWPDDQRPTFHEGTTTLWVCGDRHQDELRERAKAFGLPDEAVRFNAPPESPYGGWNLDDEGAVELLRDLTEAERPGLVYIDTVWRATRRQLRREEEVNALLDPIVTIAQDTDTAVLGLMHLSKDGETLGRRMEGLARAVMKLHRPDPEGQPLRRRLEVIGNFKEPPPLGVTMGDTGCEYDFEPPKPSSGSKGGRPPQKLEKAIAFLVEKLSAGDRKGVELIDGWVAMNEAKGTLFNAKKVMEEDGRLVVDDLAKPKVWHLVKEASETVNNPVSDPF
ncbi:MAG: AAA family ATPase [Isosphaeraceae bacterium]